MAARKGKFSKNSMVSILFFVIVAIFLILYLKRIDIQKLREVHLSWTFIAVASVFALAGRYWSILVWFVLLKSLGAKNIENHKASLAYVFAKSWMGRYIPGTAPWILGKIYFASKHGISKNKLAVSSLLEGGLQITVTIAISFVMLLLDSRLRIISGGLKLFMLAVLLGCVITIMPPVFNRMVSIAYKIIKKKTLDTEHLASGKTILRGSSLFIIGALLSGLSLFFIAKAVYPSLGIHDMLYVMGASNLAGAMGMLAVFVPSGIGVRDGILLLLLSAIMPTELALVITVIGRLWSVVMDLVFFGIAKTFHNHDNNRPVATN